jgi:hypothetical protein
LIPESPLSNAEEINAAHPCAPKSRSVGHWSMSGGYLFGVSLICQDRLNS